MTAKATTTKSGFAFHVHHRVLMEWCADYEERVQYIKKNKPIKEQELRLRLFRLIPEDRVPSSLLKAEVAYEKVVAAWAVGGATYEKAWAAYKEAEVAYKPDLIKLHEELCPGCPWDGKTIFSRRDSQ